MGCTFSSQKHKGEETSTYQKTDPGNGNKEWITNPSAETGQLKKQSSAYVQHLSEPILNPTAWGVREIGLSSLPESEL